MYYIMTSRQSVSVEPPIEGGCAGTRYGCCPNGRISKTDPEGTNCPVEGGCAGTRYGCCPNGRTSKTDPEGTNCPGNRPRTTGGLSMRLATQLLDFVFGNPRSENETPELGEEDGEDGGCASTQYGCCPPPHGKKYRNDAEGSNCPGYILPLEPGPKLEESNTQELITSLMDTEETKPSSELGDRVLGQTDESKAIEKELTPDEKEIKTDADKVKNTFEKAANSN
jgi:hypothetical protein